jgi:hypothetical protein
MTSMTLITLKAQIALITVITYYNYNIFIYLNNPSNATHDCMHSKSLERSPGQILFSQV